MSPPFSPDDDEADDPRTPGRSFPSTPPSSAFRDISSGPSYEQNVLINPELLNQLPSIGTSKNAAKKATNAKDSSGNAEEEVENDEYSKLKRATQMEHQPKINKVMVEIPLILAGPTDSNVKDGEGSSDATTISAIPRLQLSQDTRFSVHTYVPPSTPDGRWTGSMSGNSKVNQLVGSTNGSAQLSYKFSSRAHFVGGLDLLSTANNTRPCQLRLGARYTESSTSTIQMSLQQQEENSWGINLSTRDLIDPWIISSTCSWNPRKGQWRSTMSLASMTTHRLRFAMGLKNSNAFSSSTSWSSWMSWLPLSMVQVSIDPKLSSLRRAPVALQYQPSNGAWNFSASLHTAKPAKTSALEKEVASSWQVGLLGGTTKASKWSVLLAWTHGDITLRVPILLSTTLAMTRKSKEENKLVAAATPLLVLAISGIAQEMLARLIWPSAALTTLEYPDSTRSSDAIPTSKAKEDAQSQQALMKRQADTRKSAEQEKSGLVIELATYQLEDISWDVTIPLQFWVSTDTSTLSLADGSKQHLLGFYPLVNTESETDKPTSTSAKVKDHGCTKDSAAIPWWKEYWTPTTKRKKGDKNKASKENAMPRLKVNYTYRGKPFEVTIRDDESLELPRQSESAESKN